MGRTVTVRRPYSTETTYDFTAFMSASVSSLDVISAIGMENSAGTFAAHALQNPDSATTKERDGATIATICKLNDGSTPSPVTPGTSTSGVNGHGYGFGLVIAVIVGMMF